MNAPQPDSPEVHQPTRYAICIQGHLDRRWTDWLEGLTFTHETA